MKTFKQFLNKRVLTVSALAKKHDVSKEYIEKQLQRGIKVEHEHTTKLAVARRIALAHLGENPDYYKKLKKIEHIKESLYNNKLEGVKDIHGDLYVRHHTDDYGRHIYTVHHQGKKIASAKLSGQDHYVSDVDVQPEYRRRGIASKLYDFIENHTQKKLKPSPMHQTPLGKELWKNRAEKN